MASIKDAPHDRRILIFIPRDRIVNPLHHGWHAARWEDDAGQWIIGGSLWFDEAFHIDEDIPTAWKEIPDDPVT